MIDKNSPVPLYHQIKQDIKTNIKNNRYAVNEPIPSESELISIYNVSRMTVRLAIDELEKAGYVVKIQGKGTFVKKRKLTQELNMITSWSETMRMQGMVAETKGFERDVTYATDELAEQMKIEPKTKLYRIIRLKYVDGEPIGISTVYIIADVAPGLIDEPLIQDSIYSVLESKYHIEPSTALETVEAIAADEEQAKLLHISVGDPLLKVTRLTLDGDGKIFEHAQITSRADRYAYSVTLHGRKKKNDQGMGI